MNKNEKYNGKMSDEAVRLAVAFLSLSNLEECEAFFSDIFTVKEIDEISSRLEVARLLKAGENYIDIANKTGASTATISRVSKCLSGERGGYRTVLARMSAESCSNTDSDYDELTPEEEAAVRAVIACFKSRKNKRS